MSSIYQIVYEGEVVHRDIPSLDKHWKVKIKAAIENKLVLSPEVYGKPLNRTLKNYRKMRVGDYRVIFRIDAKIIRIVLINHRSKVYKLAQKRIR